MKNDTLLKVFFACILAVWMIPMGLYFMPDGSATALNGAVIHNLDTELNSENWLSGEYQKLKEKYLEENVGLRAPLIKTNNQFLYSVFGVTNAWDIILGKNDQLFENKNIKAITGFDFMGEAMIDCKTEMLKLIQDTLTKQGKLFCVIHAPNKASFMPENLPNSPHKYNPPNIDIYLNFERQKGINHVDLHKVFKAHKKSTKYDLYPVLGTHWSVYGMHLGLDSVLQYFENKTNKKQVKLDYSTCAIATAKSTDDDISDLMNLWLPLTKKKSAYPLVKVDAVGAKKANLFIVSDSYWIILDSIARRNKVFNELEFIYYDVTYTNRKGEVSTIDFKTCNLQQIIDRNDIISVMSSDAQLSTFGWGFIESLFKHYYPQHPIHSKFESYTADYAKRINIMSVPEWRKMLERDAVKQNISLSKAIEDNIEWMRKN
jgi:SGNH hydrolase-like domain, acetyltransferase AlgX